MIQHTVVFTLKHKGGSPEEEDFLEAVNVLKEISVVQDFKRLRQVSKKNSFSFGLSMGFSSEKAYKEYNDHPVHAEFVTTRWIPEVIDFMEMDYVPYGNPELRAIEG